MPEETTPKILEITPYQTVHPQRNKHLKNTQSMRLYCGSLFLLVIIIGNNTIKSNVRYIYSVV